MTALTRSNLLRRWASVQFLQQDLNAVGDRPLDDLPERMRLSRLQDDFHRAFQCPQTAAAFWQETKHLTWSADTMVQVMKGVHAGLAGGDQSLGSEHRRERPGASIPLRSGPRAGSALKAGAVEKNIELVTTFDLPRPPAWAVATVAVSTAAAGATETIERQRG